MVPMGPSPQKGSRTHNETRYLIDPQGNIHQKQVQVPDRQPVVQPQPEYRYYRNPDGTVVRQRVAPAPPAQPVQPARPPPQPAPVQQGPRPIAPPPQRMVAPAAAPRPVPSRTTHTQPRRSPRWTAKRIAKHIAVIAIICLLLLWPSTIPNMRGLVNTLLTGEAAFQPFPEVAEMDLERVLTLTSTSSIDWEIQLSEPFNIDDIHELLGLTTSPNPTREYTYKDHNWMEWSGSTPSSTSTVRITIRYDMRLYSTVWEVDEDNSGDVSDVPASYSDYLMDEWKIQPSNSEVQALSKQIVGQETNVYLILLKIYKWLDDNLDYNTQRSAEPKSCSQTLADGDGDCDDQSILLASLARAAGVPVWLNLGIIYDPVRNYWGGHGWNNVFIPMEDGTHVIATIDIVNNQFMFRDPYHVSDYIDNGNGQDLEDYYTSWSYSYSTGPFDPTPRVSSDEVYTIIDLKTTGSTVYTAP